MVYAKFTKDIYVIDHVDNVQQGMAVFRDAKVVGLDMEWKPDTATTNNPIALIQLATLSVSVLFRIGDIGGIPGEVVRFLKNPSIVKVVCGWDTADGKKLSRFKVSPENLYDISKVHRNRGFTKCGLRNLALHYLGEDVDKSLACSNWERPLTTAMETYAATDAWVALRIYYKQNPPPPEHRCKTCSKLFQTEKAQLQHWWAVHSFECDVCTDKFATAAQCVEHMRSDHWEDWCVDCEMQFASEPQAWTHHRNFHGIEHQRRSEQCPHCDRWFSTPQGAADHERVVHNRCETSSDDSDSSSSSDDGYYSYGRGYYCF